MSKVKKDHLKSGTANRKPKLKEKSAYRSVILSAVIGGILLIISILLNGEYLSLFASEDLFLQTLDITVKVLVILFFFIFMTISIGNYKELTGKPLDLKLIVLMFNRFIVNYGLHVFSSGKLTKFTYLKFISFNE